MKTQTDTYQIPVTDHCNKGHLLSGELPLKLLKRLEESEITLKGDLSYTLQFGKDDKNIQTIQGHITLTLPRRCQRCFEAFLYPMDFDFMLSPIHESRQAKQLPKAYEPILIDEEENVSLIDMLEDEIILKLPMFSYHETQECPSQMVSTDPDQGPKLKQKNPFDILESLKNSVE